MKCINPSDANGKSSIAVLVLLLRSLPRRVEGRVGGLHVVDGDEGTVPNRGLGVVDLPYALLSARAKLQPLPPSWGGKESGPDKHTACSSDFAAPRDSTRTSKSPSVLVGLPMSTMRRICTSVLRQRALQIASTKNERAIGADEAILRVAMWLPYAIPSA